MRAAQALFHLLQQPRDCSFALSAGNQQPSAAHHNLNTEDSALPLHARGLGCSPAWLARLLGCRLPTKSVAMKFGLKSNLQGFAMTCARKSALKPSVRPVLHLASGEWRSCCSGSKKVCRSLLLGGCTTSHTVGAQLPALETLVLENL